MSFQDKLDQLKREMERGLGARVAAIDLALAAAKAGDSAAKREVQREAHKIRGVAATYGHDRLGALASEVDRLGKAEQDMIVLAIELRDEAARIHEIRLSADASEQAASPETHTADEAVLRKILVIEDDEATGKLMALTLSRIGNFDVIHAKSGKDALRYLHEEFAIIISDAMMPDINGLDLCRIEHEHGHRRPVVILSAASPEELEWDIREQGPDAWMRKPIHPAKLVDDIEDIIRLFSRPPL